jgi:hypothetical protein
MSRRGTRRDQSVKYAVVVQGIREGKLDELTMVTCQRYDDESH